MRGTDLTPSESATQQLYHGGEHHDEGVCDLAADYNLKFLMSPANLSLISIIRQKEEIRGTYVSFRGSS